PLAFLSGPVDLCLDPLGGCLGATQRCFAAIQAVPGGRHPGLGAPDGLLRPPLAIGRVHAKVMGTHTELLFPLIGQPLPLVSLLLPLSAQPLPLVSLLLALIGQPLPLVSITSRQCGSPAFGDCPRAAHSSKNAPRRHRPPGNWPWGRFLAGRYGGGSS